MTITTTNETVHKISAMNNNLQRRFDSFINSPEREFFIGVADYTQYIIETTELNVITIEIIQQREEDKKKVTELEKKLIEDIERAERVLIRTINKEGVQFLELGFAIKEYAEVKDGSVKVVTPSRTEALYDDLTDIVNILYYKGHKELVRNLVLTDPLDEQIQDYAISENYQPYINQLREFKHLSETSIWASWNKLVQVYWTIYKRSDKTKAITLSWDKITFDYLLGNMDIILSGSTKLKQNYFMQDAYRLHLNRIHNYFIDFLSNAIEVAKDNQPQSQEVTQDQLHKKSDSKMTITKAKQEINKLIKTLHLIGKEKKLLTTLSDFKPHKITELVTSTTNALSHLKKRVNKKLSGTNFFIDTLDGVFSDPTGSYQLNISSILSK